MKHPTAPGDLARTRSSRLRRLALVALAVVVAGVPACRKPGKTGATGPAGPPGVVIDSLTANPSVVRPGAACALTASASDGEGGALDYAWSASAGSLSSASGNPVTWTAPDTVGSYLVNVSVSNGGGASASGVVGILVSVEPLVVTSVSPNPARAGEEIRITGAGFGAAQGTSTVTVAGVAMAVASWSDVEIHATVPLDSSTGPVVATVGGEKSSPFYITVLWATGNPSNVAISAVGGVQAFSAIVSDGAGGAIIAWSDQRGAAYDVYAQRVSNTGAPLWTADGVAVSAAAGDQAGCQIVSDGAGGAIIVWTDTRNGNSDVYAQRVSDAGVPLWTADGVAISTPAGDQVLPQIISDGAGGAIITWQDTRSGPAYDIYAQRVSSAGVPLWTADGVAISTAAGEQSFCQLVPDGTGGAIIAWRDLRSGVALDIYAQRVSSLGTPLWTADGEAICTATDYQNTPQVAPDGAGGAIIAWDDYRSGADFDVYAQRVSDLGVPLWTADGVAISTAVGHQQVCHLVPDGADGAIIAWQDKRNGVDFDIYAQRVSGAGASLWTAGGVAICTAAGDQFASQLVPDGSGGAIIAWQDFRNGADFDIFAQRVSDLGTPLWTTDGVAISTAVKNQSNVRIAPDGAGGAVLSWDDLRNIGGSFDVYSQGVNADGQP